MEYLYIQRLRGVFFLAETALYCNIPRAQRTSGSAKPGNAAKFQHAVFFVGFYTPGACQFQYTAIFWDFIHLASASCNIQRFCRKKIQTLTPSCNIQRGEIKKIQRFVSSYGEIVLCCNVCVITCIFSAIKTSILQLEVSICIFPVKKQSRVKLAERTCIFCINKCAIVKLGARLEKTSGSALYFFLQKQRYIATHPRHRELLAPRCIFPCRNSAILQYT